MSPYRNGIEFSVIRFERIEYSVDGNHAIPRAVWFEVVRFRIGDRMALQESRKIGDHGCRAILMHTKDAIVGTNQAVRAARASQNRVQLVAQKSYVGYAAYQAA